jgi:transmembrane sensor
MSARATDIDKRAAWWLQRRQFWDANPEDESAFETWMNESEAHRIAYWRQNAMWNRTERLAALGPAAPEAEPARSRALPLMLRIAAVMGAIAAIGVGAANLSVRPQDRAYSTPVGGHETISFADGTRIELNTDTVVRARMTTDQRLVWLEKGEAYFQVKHDPAHPFVVMVGDHRVTDLGTEFLIDRGAKKIEVALINGRAWFDRTGKQTASQSALLTPGDEVVATAQTMSIANKPVSELAAELSWRHGLLVFRGTTLGDAAAQFNRYNREKIVVADSKAAALKIDGTFPTDGVDVFTDAIHNVFGLRVENRGHDVVIFTAQ